MCPPHRAPRWVGRQATGKLKARRAHADDARSKATVLAVNAISSGVSAAEVKYAVAFVISHIKPACWVCCKAPDFAETISTDLTNSSCARVVDGAVSVH